jgi:hypothetical protein
MDGSAGERILSVGGALRAVSLRSTTFALKTLARSNNQETYRNDTLCGVRRNSRSSVVTVCSISSLSSRCSSGRFVQKWHPSAWNLNGVLQVSKQHGSAMLEGLRSGLYNSSKYKSRRERKILRCRLLSISDVPTVLLFVDAIFLFCLDRTQAFDFFDWPRSSRDLFQSIG